MKRCSLLFLALLFFTVAEARAEPEMQVHLGHQGLHRYRSWSPFQVRLRSGERALEGMMEVAVPSGNVFIGDAHKVYYSHPVSLPPFSAETFDFAVFIDDISRPLEVSYRGQEGKLLSQQVDLRENLVTGDFIIALSRAPVFDFLTQLVGPQGRVVYPRPERLPEKQEAYDGVRAIIIHDVNLSLLKREQLRAIKGWAALGGRLIITGGAGQGRYRILEKEALVPGRVRRTELLGKLSAMGQRYGAPLSLPAPLPVISLDNISGTVLLREKYTPLIIQRRWGQGEVLFLTFDPILPLFYRWQGFDALWADLISGSEPPDLSLSRPWENGPAHRALKSSVIPFPPLWQVALFAAAYFIAYILIRRSFRGRKSYWLTVSGMVAIFVLSAELLFYRPYLPRGYLKHQFTVIDIYPEAQLAHRRTEVSLFSAREQVMQATGAQGAPAVDGQAPASYRGEERDYQLQYGVPSGFAIKAPLKPWAQRSFNTLATIEPPVQIQVFREGKKVYIGLYNATSYMLTEGLVVVGGEMLKLNKLPPGGRFSLEVSPDTLGGSWTPLSLRDAVVGPYLPLKLSMLEDFLPGIRLEGAVTFLGWLDEGPFSGLAPQAKHSPVSLTLVRASLDNPEILRALADGS